MMSFKVAPFHLYDEEQDRTRQRHKSYMSFVNRKPVFGVSDQGRLKPACAATEAI